MDHWIMQGLLKQTSAVPLSFKGERFETQFIYLLQFFSTIVNVPKIEKRLS